MIVLAAAGCGGGSDDTAGKPTAERSVVEEQVDSAESFTNEDWAVVASDPDAHKGAHVELTAKVFSVERDADGTYLQVWADHENSNQNTIVGVADPSLPIESDDLVRIVGSVKGEFEGENAFGAELTVPVVSADSVEKVSPLDIRSPAVRTVEGAPFSETGITIEPRIELAEDETRVFLTVRNESGHALSIYTHSMHLVADGTQHDPEFSTKEYPELTNDLQSGAATEGVVVFPPIASGASLRLIVEAHSENFEIGDDGSIEASWTWSA